MRWVDADVRPRSFSAVRQSFGVQTTSPTCPSGVGQRKAPYVCHIFCNVARLIQNGKCRFLSVFGAFSCFNNNLWLIHRWSCVIMSLCVFLAYHTYPYKPVFSFYFPIPCKLNCSVIHLRIYCTPINRLNYRLEAYTWTIYSY